ncbi:MAG TPA: SDR family oxidoreductase [Candidatus Bathyarchaeia archaeon]|nr:SDR family oxidoreductase [Candidatus Bathyarchaeia archaeon]
MVERGFISKHLPSREKLEVFSLKLENKVALITGAGSGIGKAAAQLFAKEGARIVVADLDRERGEDTAKKIRADGGQSIFVETDVTKSSLVEATVSKTISEFGRVDILYNSAGVDIFVINPKADGTVVGTLEEDWDRLLAINLKGAFLFAKYTLPHMMKQRRGVVINMGSEYGIVGGLASAAYCASKGGVVLLTKQMALDYAPYNIRVNCICPCNVDTPLMEKGLATSENPQAMRKTWEKIMPLRRFSKPEEIAAGALYLASDDASFVTGTVLSIDGGVTAGGTHTYWRSP